MGSHAFATRGFPLAILLLAAGCESDGGTVGLDGRPLALTAYCEALVDGVGTVDVETDKEEGARLLTS